uniref:Putative DNA topoisomerase-primase n=1 Tax=viral metagenome TaxID=1070528 RepID=A0A6M3L121_9ZZZZ
MIDIKAILDLYDTPYTTKGKHARRGWVQVECPLCEGHKGWHGGFNAQDEYYNCWRCGWHPIREVLFAITGESWGGVDALLKEHKILRLGDRAITVYPTPHSVQLPPSTAPLGELHIAYLERRRFNPTELARIWGVCGTKHIGGYKHRIVAPITYKGRLVSYQTRAMLTNQIPKYKACEIKDEVIHHKHLVYGVDQALLKDKGDVVVVVEGITDVWRLGPGAVATFGIGWTKDQVKFLATHFKRFIICFDNEEQAQDNAKGLMTLLLALGRRAHRVVCPTPDPARMGEGEAKQYMERLMG